MDCASCGIPDVLPGNVSVLEVYAMCNNQLRSGPLGGVVGLDFNAVKIIARDMGVVTDRFFWGKIRLLEKLTVEQYRG